MAGQDTAPVRIGIVGVGNRGTGLLTLLLQRVEGVVVPAVCDINEEHLRRALKLVTDAGGEEADGYSRGPHDFERMVDRSDLDAVITATPWEWHTPVMLAAMRAGKYGATEVPAAVTLEECWELVETSEKTGVPCMLLENVNYARETLMVLGMIQQGLFGEMLHCEGGYQHDGRSPSEGSHHRFEWGPEYDKYLEEFKHPLWKLYEDKAAGSGHGGIDFMVLDQFVEAVQARALTPIDVYDAATWSAISGLSGQSVANKGAPVEFPDFTRGNWIEHRVPVMRL